MGAQRWATFDCYGTLIDWNAGIRGQLERLFGVQVAPRMLERYHELEPEIESESEPFPTYREVLTLALERLAQDESVQIPEGETDALAKSLPGWQPFPDVPPALAELRDRGWMLALLSNTDRDLIEASQRQLGVPIDIAIVAEDVGSYKPAHGHWDRFFEATTADRQRHVHVAASLFHDIAPARELGLRSVWINRLDEEAGPRPDRELTDLSGLPDTLDELVEP
jgi:2-haloacid dehalogenase